MTQPIGGVWACKTGDFQPSNFASTPTGIQTAINYCGATGGDIYVGPGTIAFGTSTLTILQPGIRIRGAGQRATKFTYSGSGDFITIGFNDGLHSGSGNAYTGIAAFIILEDIWFVGPGKGSPSRCIVDWENGSQYYKRITIDSFTTGFFGIGADVSAWQECYILKNTTGVFLGSRCDQNTFSECYFALNGIGCNVESSTGSRFKACQFVFSDTADVSYDCPASGTEGGDIRAECASTGSRFKACQFVFSDTADVRYDCPASGTEGGDIRAECASTHLGCWYESPTGANIQNHIKFGSSGTSARRTEGLTIRGGYILSNSSHTVNFIDVEAGTNVVVHDMYQAGTMTGNLVNITSVASLTPEVTIFDCRTNPSGLYLGGSTGALQTVLRRTRATNSSAFSATFATNADSGEIVEVGALTADITFSAPTSALRGRYLTYRLAQDGTGGRNVTWNSAFRHTWSNVGNVASARSVISFYYDGTNWQQVAYTPWLDGSNRATPNQYAAANIASGATITPAGGNVIKVTGTADITSITATSSDNGRVIWLIFTGTAATTGMTDGSNLKLAGNFAYTPDDTMALVCDGTNWYELSRSVN